MPAILDLMAGRKIHGMVMGELDNDPKNPSPTAPAELVKTSKIYLESLGITFRAETRPRLYAQGKSAPDAVQLNSCSRPPDAASARAFQTPCLARSAYV